MPFSVTVLTTLGWRIASTEAGLLKGAFFVRGLPPPEAAEFKDHAVRVPQGQGGQARHGNFTQDVVFAGLDPSQSNTLREIIQEGLDDAGLLYLTVDRSNGESSGRDWIDISGKPQMPEFRPREPIAGANGILHGNIRLFLNAVTIVNDPALFVSGGEYPRTVILDTLVLAGSAETLSVA